MASDVAFRSELRAPERPAVPGVEHVVRTWHRSVGVESNAEFALEWAEHREVWNRRVVLIAETSLGVAELEIPLRVTRTEADGLEPGRR